MKLDNFLDLQTYKIKARKEQLYCIVQSIDVINVRKKFKKTLTNAFL